MAMIGAGGLGGYAPADYMTLIGATLRDMSPRSSGNSIMQARQLIQQQMLMRAQMGAAQQTMGMFGSGAPGGAAPAADGADPAPQLPDVPPLATDFSAPTGDMTPSGNQAVNNVASSMAPPIATAAAQVPQIPQVSAGAGGGDGASLTDPEVQRKLMLDDMLGIPTTNLRALMAARSLPPELRAAAMANPAEFWSNYTKNYAPQALKEGETAAYMGPTGPRYTAPKLGVDAPSGTAYVQTPAGVTPQGRFGGDYEFSNGIVGSKREGNIVGGYSVPQAVAPGSSLYGFTPSASGFTPSTGIPQVGAPNASPGLTSDVAAAAVGKLFPGAQVTSGFRTPSHNAAVGGVPDSMHTRGDGQAIDFVPPKGMGFDQVRAALQQAGLPATELLDEGTHIHWGWGAKGQAAPAASSSPSVTLLAKGNEPRTLTPEEAQKLGYAPGTVVNKTADGNTIVSQPPQYNADWAKGQRELFMKSEPYIQNNAAASAVQALLKNAGNMTGPAAYSILDTFARTINPGAVARQGTLAAIEEALGPMTRLQGGWQAVFRQGKLPPEIQQQLVDAVTPFAQAHWDQAKQLRDANVSLGQQFGHGENEMAAPIGNRPERMIVAPGGAISQAQALAQARKAIQMGAPRSVVIQRLQARGLPTAGL